MWEPTRVIQLKRASSGVLNFHPWAELRWVEDIFNYPKKSPRRPLNWVSRVEYKTISAQEFDWSGLSRVLVHAYLLFQAFLYSVACEITSSTSIFIICKELSCGFNLNALLLLPFLLILQPLLLILLFLVLLILLLLIRPYQYCELRQWQWHRCSCGACQTPLIFMTNWLCKIYWDGFEMRRPLFSKSIF